MFNSVDEGVNTFSSSTEDEKQKAEDINQTFDQITGEFKNGFNGNGEGPNGKNKDSEEIRKVTVSNERLKHASLGEFNSNNRLINGGHGQENIDYLIQHNIPFNITKEYPNGVRVGNIPSHKNKIKRNGEGQAWFPKGWTEVDIKKAGEYVANLPQLRLIIQNNHEVI